MTSTVLILGAAGRIGQVLAQAFADAGWTVRAQARKALPSALAQRDGVQWVQCDALDATALGQAARGADVVVHALNPVYTQWDKLAMPLAEAAINAAREAGALLMLPGNVYNFGTQLPEVLTVRTPERGDVPKAQIRIDIEARMAATPGLDSVVIRAGDFFGGAGKGSWFDLALATRIKSGKFVYPGDPNVVHAWAYLPDLAQAFVQVARQRAQIKGAHRLHFAGHAVTGEQMRQAMEHAVGKPLRMTGMMWPLLRVLAPVVPMLREVITMHYLFKRAHRLDDTELRQLIGTVPHTPLAHALASAWREHQPSSAESLSSSARA